VLLTHSIIYHGRHIGWTKNSRPNIRKVIYTTIQEKIVHWHLPSAAKFPTYRLLKIKENVKIILYTWARASWIEFNNYPTRCDLFSLLYFCGQLYMFWLLTPIIKSSYNCNYSFWYWLTGSTTTRSRCWVGTDSCLHIHFGRAVPAIIKTDLLPPSWKSMKLFFLKRFYSCTVI